MTIGLYSLTSFLHAEAAVSPSEEPFIKEIQAAAGITFEDCGDDFASYGTHDLDLIYVRTGGTEGLFKKLELPGYIRLLTSGQSNSLAASMEILSYIRQQGRDGEIIHGSAEEIAKAILGDSRSTNSHSPFVKKLEPFDLGGMRLGIIGKPSDWLISSDVDYAKAKERTGAELVDIPMAELLEDLKQYNVDMRSFKGSEAIYEALKGIIDRHDLQGISIRCFDLLDTVHNTGCLALARLNAEGIPASCEGDIPALLSMAYLMKIKGCPGFQCNLSRIDGDSLLFAHCTVPLNMVDSFRYDTHFESGIGTAIKGEMILGDVEVFKISPDIETCVIIPGKIIENRSEKNLCRTQIVVVAEGAADYFLREPLANHHIVSYKS